METTAKVDIRKLQLLNDRIAQTIDALNQVRLSVHGLGLSHSSAYPFSSQVPYSMYGSSISPYAASPYASSPYSAYASSPYASALGLSHSASYAPSWAQSWGPWAQQSWHQSWQQPWQQQSILNPMLAHQGVSMGVPSVASSSGLAHSSPEVFGVPSMAYGQHAIGVDPFTAMRIFHSFPFAQYPISPVPQF